MGPVTPRVPKEGKLRANSQRLGPPIGVRDLPASVRTSHARRAIIPPGGVPEAPRVPQARDGRGSSTGRLVHPPHSMRVIEAWSATAARGAAFARSHCRPRITEVYSAAACAASAQSTTLFHHAAYAASYTARSATQQATPQATPGAVSTRQRMDMLDGGFPRAGKEIQE